MTRFPSFSALVLGGAIGAATLLSGGGTAEAGRIRFGGSAHFSGRAHFSSGGWHGRGSIRFSRPAWRSSWRPRGWFGGNVWIGGGYYYPRSYYYYYPEYVPSYYGAQAYYPVQPTVEAAPGVVEVVRPRPAQPTFGVGVFAGGVSVKDRQDSSDLGLLGRFRLTPGLLIEGEIGKTSFENDRSSREDRRIGGSLIWEIGAPNVVAPYLLAGGGVQQARVNDDFTTTQEFGEIGVGLRVALSRNLHLTADIRAGRRKSVDSDQPIFVGGDDDE